MKQLHVHRGACGPIRGGRGGRGGAAAVGMVVALVVISLIVIGITTGSARDHDMTVRRVETIEALYAAEAGINMSIRERMTGVDEDGDGVIGTISNDGNAANDPALGIARFHVTLSAGAPLANQTTLISKGRSGEARRKLNAVVE